MNTPARPSPEELQKQQFAILEETTVAFQFSALSKKVKKRALVAFFGRSTFADNTKYLYLKAVAKQRDYEVVWCTAEVELANSLSKAGLPVHLIGKNIDHSIDLLMHTAVAVFSVNPSESLKGSPVLTACLDGAQKIQLWHGVSVKHLVLTLIPHLSVRELGHRRPWEFASRADYVLSTASCFDAYWRRVFGCTNLVRAGFPRNEVILREPTPHEMIGCDVPKPMFERLNGAGKKVLVVPTWQRERPTWLTSEDALRLLAETGMKEGISFFVKAHPTYFATVGNNTQEVGGLQLLHPGVDVYPILSKFDALVTDYSSIQFDFLHTRKPVLTLDLQPGEHTKFEPDWSLVPNVDFRYRFSPKDLPQQLDKALYSDTLESARGEMLAKIFESDPMRACDALLHLIERLVEQSQADDFSVDYCGQPNPAETPVSDAPAASKRVLTDAAE